MPLIEQIWMIVDALVKLARAMSMLETDVQKYSLMVAVTRPYVQQVHRYL